MLIPERSVPLVAVLDAMVPRRPIEAPGALPDQLIHLAKVADLPHARNLVVPEGTEIYSGPQGGCVLVTLADGSVVGAPRSPGPQARRGPGGRPCRPPAHIGGRPGRSPLAAAVTRSDQGGGAGMDVTGARWHKSTRSGTNGGSCVEVADNLPGVVPARDTKGRDGGTLRFDPGSWQAFVEFVRRHRVLGGRTSAPARSARRRRPATRTGRGSRTRPSSRAPSGRCPRRR